MRLKSRLVRKAKAQSNRVRNRSFRTLVRFDDVAPTVVLSPHLDDAVIDCWSVLTSPRQVEVFNVFTAVPSDPTPTAWDRICGASDAAAHTRARIAEDEAALRLADRTATNLGFLDAQYRVARRQPLFEELDTAVREVAPVVSVAYAPACLGVGHEDHALVRDYAMRLRGAGIDVVLYADAPYAVQFGWPAWVSGSARDPHLDVDVAWERGMRSAGLTPADAEVVRLPPRSAQRKLAAMRMYATQFSGLNQGCVGLLENPEIHGTEVYWRLS